MPPSGAHVFALEHPLHKGNDLVPLRDLQMMVVTGGRERSPAHIAELFQQAGLAYAGTAYSSSETPLYAAIHGTA